jgi:hypothetical protein
MFDVCTTGDRAHIDTILKFLPHKKKKKKMKKKKKKKKKFFSFPVALKNSIKVGPLAFLL